HGGRATSPCSTGLAGAARGRTPPRAPCPLLLIGRGAPVPTLVVVDVGARERAYLRVAGPDACDYLQRMVSNDVEALQVGDACPALLLTAKARVIAPLVVWRRGDEDFLLLTEPELGEPVRSLLVRMRLRARCEIE